jgi:hypothetical protein
MRCLSCDRRLSDRESTRKYASSGTFVDLCDRCFSTVSEEIPDIESDIPFEDHFDTEDFDNEPFEWEDGEDELGSEGSM